MPAVRLKNGPVGVKRFDVCGQDSDHIPEFIRHVGLTLHEMDELSQESLVQMVHMGPPFGQDTSDDASEVDAVATVKLTSDEQLQIQLFVDELDSEYKAEKARPERQFVIRPHAAPPDDKFPFWRFSCSGFTIQAYREAGIELLIEEQDKVPLVSLDVLKKAYPDQSDSLDREKIRAMYGLDGDGPWPVVLAGYVINALRRDVEIVRKTAYQANTGDEYFPPHSPDNDSNEDKTESVDQ